MEFSRHSSSTQSRSKHKRFHSPSPSRPHPPSTSKRRKTHSKHTTITKHYTHHHSKSSHRHRDHTRKHSRQWVFSPYDFSHLKDEIVVVSYNILAVKNAEKHPSLYDQVPRRYLDWEKRKLCIRRELNLYKASILCLQEVDQYSDLSELLKKDGFDGIYKARTGDACDGCAIFWREELFTLLHHESIEFREFDLRDNVAQFCVLEMKSNYSDDNAKSQISERQAFLIGNTHTLFNPKRGDIKIGQIRLFLKKAHKLSKEWGNIPVVIAGDLNSTPESAIYQFLASSELDLLRHNRRQLSGQLEDGERWRSFRARTEVSSSWSKEDLQLAAGSEEITHLQHNLQLRSAYVGVPGSSRTRDRYGEPLVTTYHSSFMGTVDYIWHSKDLVPVGVVETLPIDMLRKMRGLPTEEWGSDHFALVCKLALSR